MSIIRKNNIHIRGNQDAAQTLVLGHGFGIDQQSFSQVIPAFEKDYRIVLYDNVGGGQADLAAFSPMRYATTNGYVTDLMDILQELQLPRVTFVGHSVSGMIGMLSAIKNPDYFEQVVLMGSSPRYLDDPAANYTGGFDDAALESLFEAMETNYQAWAIGFSALAMRNQERPELAEAFAMTLKEIRPDIAVSVARAIFHLDHRQELAKVSKPVLIIQTANDIAVPPVVSEYMEQHIPGSKRIKVQTQGHFPHISAPAEVIGALQSFL
ncbi:alpha/beta fold hydrolase [Chitinophaga solisilvae]|uniref:Alpha/beta hydrolase n=1 Tax=Chitinophaga solisilvae TaxID=1233460 RepID=A0A3S1AY99_9BACT|nr:alpha/beta hydrolase [Chitinophaga solisilvae]NSL87531.1 alpha/beta hydrolase [Chitinophaga solisilvae]